MKWRKAKFNDHGTIDCQVEAGGIWFPFTANPDDPEEHGRHLYQEILPVLTGDQEAVSIEE